MKWDLTCTFFCLENNCCYIAEDSAELAKYEYPGRRSHTSLRSRRRFLFGRRKKISWTRQGRKGKEAPARRPWFSISAVKLITSQRCINWQKIYRKQMIYIAFQLGGLYGSLKGNKQNMYNLNLWVKNITKMHDSKDSMVDSLCKSNFKFATLTLILVAILDL